MLRLLSFQQYHRHCHHQFNVTITATVAFDVTVIVEIYYKLLQLLLVVYRMPIIACSLPIGVQRRFLDAQRSSDSGEYVLKTLTPTEIDYS